MPEMNCKKCGYPKNPQYGTGERIVNAIGKVIIAVVVVPLAWVIRKFKR